METACARHASFITRKIPRSPSCLRIHPSKPSLSYTNKILESWYSEGLTTPEAVDAASAKKNGDKQQGMSFDVDEFFKAALDRSYRDEKK